MNTLRNKLAAIGLAGTVGLGAFAIPSVPASAAPVAPSQNTVKQSAPQQTEDVQWRRNRGRWIAPAIALGVVGGALYANNYYRRPYYDPYYRPHPAYYSGYNYYGPNYYYGPRRYYGW